MIIFLDLPTVEVEEVEIAQEIILTLPYNIPNGSLPLMWDRIVAHPKSLYTDAA